VAGSPPDLGSQGASGDHAVDVTCSHVRQLHLREAVR
jgi:hypothetical protein